MCMTFINNYSWKCLLGKQSKNIIDSGDMYYWIVGKRNHFCVGKTLSDQDLQNSNLTDYNFHYMTPENVEILKKYYKVDKSKNISTCINLDKFTISGNVNSSVRSSYNAAARQNLTIETNYRSINDVKIMLEEWSNVLAQKYFRDFSGKNYYYYSNNYHSDCINLFLYKEDKLVSFASASPGEQSTYIIGKALCNEIKGLSEYTDILLYNKLRELGVKVINLGQSKGKLHDYKIKFAGAFDITHYDGTIGGRIVQ